MQKPKISFVLLPDSWRYPAHIGAMAKFFEESLDDPRFRPTHIAGISAGALAAATGIPWTMKNFSKAIEITKNLRPQDLYGYSKFLKGRLGAVEIGDIALPIILSYFLGKIIGKSKSKKRKYLTEAMRGLSNLGFSVIQIKQILSAPSMFSSQPLRELLKKTLNFRAIFDSDIRLEVISVNRNTGQPVLGTNYLPKDKYDLHKEDRLVDKIVGSASPPGIFRPVSTPDGEELGDGAILAAFPIKRAIAIGADIIIVFSYKKLTDYRSSDHGLSAIEILQDAWSISIGEVIRQNVERLQEINQNILTLQKFQKHLREDMGARGEDVDSLAGQFTFDNKRYVKVFLVETDREIPEIELTEFNKKDNVELMNIGYRATEKIIPEIKTYLDSLNNT